MNIIQISKKLINTNRSPLINIFKKNFFSNSLKNSLNFNTQKPFNFISSKKFFSEQKEKDQKEQKEQEQEANNSEKEQEKEQENTSNSNDTALNEKYKELKTLYNEQEAKLEQTRKKFHEIKDLYLKNVDEIDAIKNRNDREIKNAKDYAITKFAKDLLDVHDNFTRALNVISDKDFKSLNEEEKTETFDSFVEG